MSRKRGRSGKRLGASDVNRIAAQCMFDVNASLEHLTKTVERMRYTEQRLERHREAAPKGTDVLDDLLGKWPTEEESKLCDRHEEARAELRRATVDLAETNTMILEARDAMNTSVDRYAAALDDLYEAAGQVNAACPDLMFLSLEERAPGLPCGAISVLVEEDQWKNWLAFGDEAERGDMAKAYQAVRSAAKNVVESVRWHQQADRTLAALLDLAEQRRKDVLEASRRNVEAWQEFLAHVRAGVTTNREE